MKQQSGKNYAWIWIPGLFASEAVVSATVTYVTLLMFVQFGASYFTASTLSALLLLPSVMKQKVLFKNKRNIHLKRFTIAMQVCLFIALLITAFTIKHSKHGLLLPFICILAVAVINALNEKSVANYYNNQLDRKQQNILGNYKFVTSQISFIVTYGILIIFVGLHEIVFRNIRLAWAIEFYMIAGVLLLLLLANLILMKRPSPNNAVNYRDIYPNANHRKIRARNIRFLMIISMLLMPQALLFTTRVFFLMAHESDGGLGCTLQDVGFAQGTIGVIAFAIGTFSGQKLIRRFGSNKMFWILILPLIISPIFYLIMNFVMIKQMLYICCMTFAAQFCFGFGLNICVVFINRSTDILEDNIINLIHNPIVVTTMFIPVACSGLLLQICGFKLFFIINALSALASIITLASNFKFINRHIINYKRISTVK